MTKREICERLIKTRDYLAAYEKLLLKDNCPFDADNLGACADALRDLILDLAAPETELGDKAWYEICPWRIRGKSPFGVECSPLLCSHCARKPENKEPPVLIYEENGEKVPCPVCGAPAAPIKNKPGVFLCKRCHGLVCAEDGNAPSRGIKEQFLALGEKAIKRIDFGKVADAEWEICSDSRAQMHSWARGAIEGAVSKVISGSEEAEFAFGCLDAKASRKHGRLRIELNHRRTNQYVEVEEEEQETK